MAIDAFLKIDGIPGEATDAQFKDWIEIQDFDVGASQTASISATSSGGASSGRAKLGDFYLKKLFDKSTPKLHEACCSGKHFKEITISINRAGGDKIKFFDIILEEAIITSVGLTGNGTIENSFPDETIRINYGRIKMIYTQQLRSDGTGSGQVTAGWDAISNKIYA
ncbi:MAG: type VI secretion system tube protein Hcp [Pseudomonas sp.]|nr:type VI secretion system tube protein Hcp [Pseudomonas sp.]